MNWREDLQRAQQAYRERDWLRAIDGFLGVASALDPVENGADRFDCLLRAARAMQEHGDHEREFATLETAVELALDRELRTERAIVAIRFFAGELSTRRRFGEAAALFRVAVEWAAFDEELRRQTAVMAAGHLLDTTTAKDARAMADVARPAHEPSSPGRAAGARIFAGQADLLLGEPASALQSFRCALDLLERGRAQEHQLEEAKDWIRLAELKLEEMAADE